MADVTISQLNRGLPAGSHLIPYSDGVTTQTLSVSSIFQNPNYNPIGIGTSNPIRHLHVASTGESVEQVWEQKNGMPDFRKWNLVISNANNATGVKSGIAIRQLNDAGTGGNVIWSYNSSLSAHFVSGAKQLIEVRDYGSSQTTPTILMSTNTIVCMGYISIGPNTYKDISNLPYSTINTYVAFVQNNGLEPSQGINGWALGQPEKISASTLRVWSQSDSTQNVNWMAIGY